ncbi:hypothetical protein M430DRAFT_37496, partial [Amorphotheca resinae ATCC 22711]
MKSIHNIPGVLSAACSFPVISSSRRSKIFLVSRTCMLWLEAQYEASPHAIHEAYRIHHCSPTISLTHLILKFSSRSRPTPSSRNNSI